MEGETEKTKQCSNVRICKKGNKKTLRKKETVKNGRLWSGSKKNIRENRQKEMKRKEKKGEDVEKSYQPPGTQ